MDRVLAGFAALFCGALCLAFPPSGLAQSAVSAGNAKLGFTIGEVGNEAERHLEGSLALPVDRRYGLQADIVLGERLDRLGLGAQFFWRDPARGSLGLIASRAEAGSIALNRFGVAGERYLGKTTLGGQLGHQKGNNVSKPYGDARVRYYATENFFLQAVVGYVEGSAQRRINLEWQPGGSSLAGLTLSLSAAGGSRNADHVLLGVRYYFGATKPLVRRHREDDPENSATDSFVSNAATLRGSACNAKSTTLRATEPVPVVADVSLCRIGLQQCRTVSVPTTANQEVDSTYDCRGRLLERRRGASTVPGGQACTDAAHLRLPGEVCPI